MPLNPGDQVAFLNEAGGGTVVRLIGDRAVLEDEHGFEREVSVAELVLLSGKEELRAQLLSKEPPEDAAGKKRTAAPKPERKPEEEEIDLHIHALTDSHKHLSNREIILIQTEHFRRAFDDARNRRLRKLIVIHGVGKGVLKEEIRKMIRDTERCSFEDADYLKYGRGATEIRFW